MHSLPQLYHFNYTTHLITKQMKNNNNFFIYILNKSIDSIKSFHIKKIVQVHRFFI